MKTSGSKFNVKVARNLILTVIFLTIFFSVGYMLGMRGYASEKFQYPNVTISRDNPAGKETLDFSLFWNVWDTLGARYFDKDKLIPAKMVYGAIEGMVAAVGDPYTVFLPPSENNIIQEDLQGNFEGVGIQIGFKGSQLVVIAPLPGSPAAKAGVQAGDFIIGIKDEAKDIDRGTVGITLPEAVEAIRGEANTSVTLYLTREGELEPIELEIKREAINVPSVSTEFVERDGQKIAHVKVLKFGGETLDEWDEAVSKILVEPNLAGIVVDVRSNPGGYLQGAVELASDFLETGDVVVAEESGDGSKSEYRVEKLGRLQKGPVVVLIDPGSASASEIFAGALNDHNRAELIGTTSFGKGTIQEPEQIEGGAGLHITVARWLTPNGTWVNDVGIAPDIEVEDNPDTPEDEVLDKAIENLLGKS